MHSAVESDVYKGYYIPKGMLGVPRHLFEFVLMSDPGATVTANVWYNYFLLLWISKLNPP